MESEDRLHCIGITAYHRIIWVWISIVLQVSVLLQLSMFVSKLNFEVLTFWFKQWENIFLKKLLYLIKYIKKILSSF